MARFVLAAVLCTARIAAAEDECRVVDVNFTPSEDLQIVAWIEDAAGNYVDTAFITQTTGLRGLGNRTGMMDLKSGPKWPYGAREDVLPIWAHRHGMTFPAVVFQSTDGANDCNMSRAFQESSPELYYCRPMMPTEEQWDTGTCASAVFTDKGFFSTTETSLYPPRADITRTGTDSPSVEQYTEMNPFDTISQATPPADMPYRFTWLAPPGFPAGDYVLRVEVSKERDFNVSFDESQYPTSQCAWLDYGVPYRGQPSVTYDVPFSFAATDTTGSVDAYTGYSDVAGVLHAPDGTITTDTPGSGGSRLRVALAPDSSMYRVRVETRIEHDALAPNAIGAPTVTKVEATSAQITFTAPGDDGDQGLVSAYEIRYRLGDSLDETTFASATPLPALEPKLPGQLQRITLEQLSPYSHYVVGIRALDNCGHTGPLTIVELDTLTVEVGCGCRTSDPVGPAGLAFGLVALRLRRRRRTLPAR